MDRVSSASLRNGRIGRGKEAEETSHRLPGNEKRGRPGTAPLS